MSKYQLSCHQLKVGDVCISLSHYKSEAASAVSAASASSREMRPPPPPNEMQLERRRSNSASPSDKLLLKRTASATSPLASTRPLHFYSPTKQVMFADEANIVQPMKKRKLHLGETTTSTTSTATSEAALEDDKNAHYK